MIMMMNGDDGMNEKRFTLGYVCGDFGLIDNDEWIDLHSMSENSEKNVRICINKMNELADENEQLKTQLQNTSDQRDEFHRGARENANRVGELERENEQLKQENKKLKEDLEHCANQFTNDGKNVLLNLR